MVIQGRGDICGGKSYWVSVFHIEYSSNGHDWLRYNEGIAFEGNHDRNTPVEIKLEDLLARSIRLVVHQWESFPCLRFAAFFEDENKSLLRLKS